MWIAVSFLLLSQISKNVLGTCSNPVHRLWLVNNNDLNIEELANNSAHLHGIRIKCEPANCGNTTYTVKWFNNHGHTPSNSIAAAVYSVNDILDIYKFKNEEVLNSSDIAGVYTCRIQSSEAMEEQALHIGVYKHSIGKPNLEPIVPSWRSYYPLAVNFIATSSKYPPTNMIWERNGIETSNSLGCGLDVFQNMMDSSSTEYDNVLSISETSGCSYEGEYSVTVNTNGGDNVTEMINITRVSSPTNLAVSYLSDNSITFSWSHNAPQHAAPISKYCLILPPNTTCTNDNRTFEMTLPVNGYQNFTVFLVNIGGPLTIPSYPESIFLILKSPSPPTIHLKLLNSTSLHIQWYNDKSNEAIPISNVLLNITSNCSKLNSYINLTISDGAAQNSSYIFNELHSGLHYCVEVTLLNPWGISKPSNMECFFTLQQEVSAPVSAPDIINITNISSYCSPVHISWSLLPCSLWNGALLYYLICINEITGPYNITANDNCIGPHSIQYLNHGTAENLKPYTKYRVRVARVNIGSQMGPFSNEKTFTTAECGSKPPVKVEVVNITIKTVSLGWIPPEEINGVLKGYIVNYWSLESPSDKDIIITETTSLIITDLFPNRLYNFNISAQNGAGEGSPIKGTYHTNPIDKVGDIEVASLQNSLQVKWSTLPSPDIDYYVVAYSVGDSMHGNLSLSGRDAISTPLLMIRDVANNTEYTVLVAAGVTVNKTINITGPWNTKSGCHGSCPMSWSTYFLIGGTVGGTLVLLILITLIVTFILLFICRRSKPRYVDEFIQMKQGGEAPVIVSKPADQYVSEGDDVILQAYVTGHPIPEITWFFNNSIVADDEYYELTDEGEDCSKLLVHNATPAHAGVYHFTAANALGSVEGQIRVFVKLEPIEETDANQETESGLVRNGQSNCAQGSMYTSIANLVPLSNLAKYVMGMNRNNKEGFGKQFEALKTFNFQSHSFGISAENKRRNRFEDVVPYDENRVVLKKIEGRGDCNHTYINASYINGYVRQKQFIATQAPLPQTLVDFWRLIWQENVEYVIMLLRDLTEGGLIRCQQYWPDSGTSFYGPYKVSLECIEEHTNYKLRIFQLSPIDSSNGCSPRRVHHIQFTGWPNHGLPESVSPLVSLVKEIEIWLPTDHPVLVHCSAGVGRTGVLLSMIIAMERAWRDGHVDFVETVNTLRKQRMNMIQNEEQYAFVHHAVLEGVYCEKTTFNPGDLSIIMRKMDLVQESTKMNLYEAQFMVLEALSLNPDKVLRNSAIDNPRLSRSKLFLPPDDHRVVLQKKEKSNFIHASFLNGYKQAKAFIVAESPTVNTVSQFWQMILEQQCAVIVMLCDLVELGEDTCYPYWPASVDSEKHVGEYRLKNIREYIDKNYTELHLMITDTQSEETHSVVQLQLPQWSPSGESSNQQSIIATISRIEVIQRKTGNRPILVHCSDTVTRSGVFCTLYNAVQQCKAENMVDIYQLLKALRTQKPALVPNKELYKLVHVLLGRFLESEFDIYRNFTKSTEYLNES